MDKQVWPVEDNRIRALMPVTNPAVSPWLQWCCRLSRPLLPVVALIIFVESALALNLDDAVTEQLGFGPTPCFILLDNGTINPEDVLEDGPLRKICQRSLPSDPPGPSQTIGGGAAVSGTRAAIFDKEQAEDHTARKKFIVRTKPQNEVPGEKSNQGIPGASADDVVNFDNGLAGFASVQFGQLERKRTSFEDGYESDLWRLTFGADYEFPEGAVMGLAVDYYHHDGLYEGGGGFQNDTYDLLGFMSFLPLEDTFVQIVAGWSLTVYERNRFVRFTDTRLLPRDLTFTVPVASGIVQSDYKSYDLSAGVLVGYDYRIGQLRLRPQVGLDWMQREFDTYSEEGDTGLELRFHKYDETFLQSRVGMLASLPFRTQVGVILPQLRFAWLHEFEHDRQQLEVSFVGDTRAKRFTYETERPDRDWIEFSAGISATLPFRLQVYGGYRTIFKHQFFDSYVVTIGIRSSF